MPYYSIISIPIIPWHSIFFAMYNVYMPTLTRIKRILICSLICMFLVGCVNPNKPIAPKQIHLSEKTYQDDTEAWLDQALDAFLPSGYLLPAKTDTGETVTWKVVEGNAIITNNHIEKTEAAQEYEPIVLAATTSSSTSEYTFDHLLLLDPYVGYIISYFTKKGDDKETLKLAYTYNGYYWFNLDNANTFVRPTIGTGSLRDPSVVRRKDGTFTVIATQGFDTDSIYAYDTTDFLTYENERLLNVNKSSSSQPMSETQAWAPEGFYDRRFDQYILYWSSVNDKSMFYNISPDLKTISYPQKLLDVGYEVIDGTIFKNGANYYIIVKDEREPYEEHSQLSFGLSSGDWRHFDTFLEPFSDHECEGPMVLKDLEGDGYYIFYDYYTMVQFKALYMKDLAKQSFKPIAKEDMMIPLTEPGHSSAIPVTWKELERLFNVVSY